MRTMMRRNVNLEKALWAAMIAVSLFIPPSPAGAQALNYVPNATIGNNVIPAAIGAYAQYLQLPNGNFGAAQADSSGYLKINCVTGCSGGGGGGGVVTQPTASLLNATVVGAGTAGSPSGGIVSIQGVASGTNVPVSGTVTANAGTGNFTVTQATGTSLHSVTDSGSVTNATLQAGSAIIGKVTTDQTTPGTTDLVHGKDCEATTPTTCDPVQPNNDTGGSAATTVGLVSSAWMHGYTGGNWYPYQIAGASTDGQGSLSNGTYPTTSYNYGWNGVTWDRLKSTAGALNISGSVTLSGTGNANLTQVGGAAIALGQTTASASIPVALASDVNPCLTNVPSTFAVSALGAGTTQVAAAVGGQSVYVCGYSVTFTAGTTDTIKFESGTGSNCASTQAAQSGAMGFTLNALINSPGGLAPAFVTPTSSTECLVVAGTTPALNGWVTYVQR